MGSFKFQRNRDSSSLAFFYHFQKEPITFSNLMNQIPFRNGFLTWNQFMDRRDLFLKGINSSLTDYFFILTKRNHDSRFLFLRNCPNTVRTSSYKCTYNGASALGCSQYVARLRARALKDMSICRLGWKLTSEKL